MGISNYDVKNKQQNNAFVPIDFQLTNYVLILWKLFKHTNKKKLVNTGESETKVYRHIFLLAKCNKNNMQRQVMNRSNYYLFHSFVAATIIILSLLGLFFALEGMRAALLRKNRPECFCNKNFWNDCVVPRSHRFTSPHKSTYFDSRCYFWILLSRRVFFSSSSSSVHSLLLFSSLFTFNI